MPVYHIIFHKSPFIASYHIQDTSITSYIQVSHITQVSCLYNSHLSQRSTRGFK